MNGGHDECIGQYVEFLRAAGRPETTIRLRRQQLQQAARRLGRLDRVGSETLLTWMARQQWAPETRRSYRSGLQGFYRWAVTTNRIDSDPAAGLPAVPQRPGVPRPAPDDVYRHALRAASPSTVLMLRLAAEVGLRRGEIARVHHTDATLTSAGWSLRVTGKGQTVRVVPIPDNIGDHIHHADGWLFPGRDHGHLTPLSVGERAARALPHGWTLHTLRHRYATRAYRGSRNLRAVQELLGHASVATTQRYTAVDDDELRATMQAAQT